ncbi:MAG: hypothetical protein QOF38_3827, partial [Pseudonocardiales bacterium]|nr:hypothetical protein [Pseudonocardiales bacterium]
AALLRLAACVEEVLRFARNYERLDAGIVVPAP